MPKHHSKALIGTADDKAVALCCISCMLHNLYAFIKVFNKLIGRAEAYTILKLPQKLIYNIFILK